MRPPNKEEFSKLKVVLDCMLAVFQSFEERPCHLYVIEGKLKIYCMLSKKFLSPHRL